MRFSVERLVVTFHDLGECVDREIHHIKRQMDRLDGKMDHDPVPRVQRKSSSCLASWHLQDQGASSFRLHTVLFQTFIPVGSSYS